jgi:glutamine amidotransferase
MNSKIVIVDSGSANLRSIEKALQKVGAETAVTDNQSVIAQAKGIIFPGVGAFEQAMTILKNKDLPIILRESIDAGIPFLGICLGLQLLFTGSEERKQADGSFAQGLDVLAGQVKRFPPGLPVPHVGWNQVLPRRGHPLFAGIPSGTYFYFTHSYFVEPQEEKVTLSVTDYNNCFTSAVAEKNLMGVQFHPEKSGPAGLRLLNNFLNIVKDPSLLKGEG